jgi:hypothetical protein
VRKYQPYVLVALMILAAGLAAVRSGGTNGTTTAQAVDARSASTSGAITGSATVRTASASINKSTSGAQGTTAVGGVQWSHIGQRVTVAASNTLGSTTTTTPATTGDAPINPYKSQVTIATRNSATALLNSTAVVEQQEIRAQQLLAFFQGIEQQQVQQYLAAVAAQKAAEAAQSSLAAAAAQKPTIVVTPKTAPEPAPAPAPAPAAAPAASGGGYAGGVWAALRNCESSGNYAENTGNGFYGAYQFLPSTWWGLGYTGYPNDASPAVQDQAAMQLQVRSGWGQWPECARKLGLL